jgi:hypothetical protein
MRGLAQVNMEGAPFVSRSVRVGAEGAPFLSRSVRQGWGFAVIPQRRGAAVGRTCPELKAKEPSPANTIR